MKKSLLQYYIVNSTREGLSWTDVCLSHAYLYRFCVPILPPLFLIMRGLCHMIFTLQPLCIDKTPLELV